MTCACRPRVAPSVRLPRMHGVVMRAPGIVRARGPIARERVAPHVPQDVEQITLDGGNGARCRPFLVVQKDPERFAACNKLADQIGPINTPKKAFKLLMGSGIGDEVNEVFGVVTLDLHLRMKSIAETGRGEPTSVMAPIVPTLQAAVADGAHAVFIFHVHPSGVKAEPSDADRETTEAYVDAFETIDIRFLDHVIVAGDSRKRSYYSFLEHNDL